MVVFTFVFSRIAKLPSDGIPYPVMVFAAMLPWQLFATSLSEGSGSLINNANLISKVYFPRLIALNLGCPKFPDHCDMSRARSRSRPAESIPALSKPFSARILKLSISSSSARSAAARCNPALSK
jgi:hypothetical protein